MSGATQGARAPLKSSSYAYSITPTSDENQDKKMNGLVNSHRKKYNVSKDAMISVS